jgi:hypothetical protein
MEAHKGVRGYVILKIKIIIKTNDIYIYTVKPVYSGHPLDLKKAAV